MKKHEQMDSLITRLNEVSGNDPVIWRRIGNDNIASVGSFTIDGNIGGYRVERIENDGGGVSCPFGESRYSQGNFIQHLRVLIAAFNFRKSA